MGACRRFYHECHPSYIEAGKRRAYTLRGRCPMRRLLICAAAAGLLSPAFAAGGSSPSFECRGIGSGKHTKGMSEDQCRKMGGTVVFKNAQEPYGCKGIGSGKHFKSM